MNVRDMSDDLLNVLLEAMDQYTSNESEHEDLMGIEPSPKLELALQFQYSLEAEHVRRTSSWTY